MSDCGWCNKEYQIKAMVSGNSIPVVCKHCGTFKGDYIKHKEINSILRNQWNWISVEDALPIVPEKNYAITVLVVIDDVMYGESCNCDGRYVTDASFCKESQLFEQMECGSKGYDFQPVCDPVTHWMYLPGLPDK